MLLTDPAQLKHSPQRIISLVPSQTELLAYLGLEERVIGITKFCVHPRQWFETKTRIGGTKTVNLSRIKVLSPDLIIANKEENVREQVEELAENYPVWVTDVNTIEDSLSMIAEVGKLTGTSVKAELLFQELRSRLLSLPDYPTKIIAAYLIWKDPLMVAGGDTFINDMMRIAGFTNVFKDYNRYPLITPGELSKSVADVILLSSEPYPFNKSHIAEIEALYQNKKPVIQLVDGEMFSWYGSRMVNAVSYLHSLQIDINKAMRLL